MTRHLIQLRPLDIQEVFTDDGFEMHLAISSSSIPSSTSLTPRPTDEWSFMTDDEASPAQKSDTYKFEIQLSAEEQLRCSSSCCGDDDGQGTGLSTSSFQASMSASVPASFHHANDPISRPQLLSSNLQIPEYEIEPKEDDSPISRYRKETDQKTDSDGEDLLSATLVAAATTNMHPLLIPNFLGALSRPGSAINASSPLSLDSRLAHEISSIRQRIERESGIYRTDEENRSPLASPTFFSESRSVLIASTSVCGALEFDANNEDDEENEEMLIQEHQRLDIELMKASLHVSPLPNESEILTSALSCTSTGHNSNQQASSNNSLASSFCLLPPLNPAVPLPFATADTLSCNFSQQDRHGSRRNRRRSLVDEEGEEDDADNESVSSAAVPLIKLLDDTTAPIQTNDILDDDENHVALEESKEDVNSDQDKKGVAVAIAIDACESIEGKRTLEEKDDDIEISTPKDIDHACTNKSVERCSVENITDDMHAVTSPNGQRRADSPLLNSSSVNDDLPRRPSRFPLTRAATTGQIQLLEMEKTLSLTESDVGSLDGLPDSLKTRLGSTFQSETEALQRIDGIREAKRSIQIRSLTPVTGEMHGSTPIRTLRPSSRNGSELSIHQSQAPKQAPDSLSFFSNWPLRLLWGEGESESSKGQDYQRSVLEAIHEVPGCCQQDSQNRPKNQWSNEDDSLALLACANLIHHRTPASEPVKSSLIRVTNQPLPLSYAQAYLTSHNQTLHDPRMPAWVDSQFRVRDKSSKDGQYLLGKSRAVIVHEIVRGNWTWATAWSPDGCHLAVATENHHLAVVDTTSSTVWRVRHDKKLQGPIKNATTHSIRSIAWGNNYIAIGGTGNAVSILSPIEPYTILQTIPNCGFVGSLDWRLNSNDLAIGSRLDRAIIVRVRPIMSTATPPSELATGESFVSIKTRNAVSCDTICTVERKHWVQAVAFSRSGHYLAVGDAGGHLLVYNYHDYLVGDNDDAPLDEKKELLGLIKSFSMDDSILAVEWSPDGSWLYAGGEDFTVTVIDTEYWEIVHKIKRDRWVQCIAASHSGTHVAVGGVSSEVSLLETPKGWESVMGMELNGLVPLSASWHPNDQFLSLTGQNNSIIIVETTNSRHVRGHHLHSVQGILAVDFSPDGRMAVIGNESGVITFYSLSGSTFMTSYELVVTVTGDCLSIQWSKNGLFVAIATRDSLLIVGRRKKDRYGRAIPPKCSGFSIRKVIKDLKGVNAVSIDLQSQYIAVCGSKGMAIHDITRDFHVSREWTSGPVYAAAWSPLGRWLATIGKDKVLTIYDTSEERIDRWRPVFSVACDFVGRALAWGPLIVGGLLYLAYAGDCNEVTVMEIRTQEGTWETVLRIQRSGTISALDWHMDGLLAVALSNGTVSIIDLAYLQSGVAVNEMDYNWQRQALTSFTEIRRNRGSNKMRTARWIPSAPGSDSLLAVGGTDGEIEIVDLTERQRCRGYTNRQ